MGEALRRPYRSRSAANWAEFLGLVDAWLPVGADRISAILDNLQANWESDVLLFALAHPRWEIVFEPKYAANLHRIEP